MHDKRRVNGVNKNVHNQKKEPCFTKCFNPFPNKPCLLLVCSTSLLKTLEMLPKINSTIMFHRCLLNQAKLSCAITIDEFLAPPAVGQRAYVMARCPSCVRQSVLALIFL